MIPVIVYLYYRKYAVPFFLGHPVYQARLQKQEVTSYRKEKVCGELAEVFYFYKKNRNNTSYTTQHENYYIQNFQ